MEGEPRVSFNKVYREILLSVKVPEKVYVWNARRISLVSKLQSLVERQSFNLTTRICNLLLRWDNTTWNRIEAGPE